MIGDGPSPRSVGEIELWRVRAPLVAPHVAAHGTEVDREVVLVAARGVDGEVGWGECDALSLPTYTSEWIDGAWQVLGHASSAWLAGRPLALRGHPMASSALGGALVDLELRRQGRSLHGALGATRGAVPRATVVSAEPGDVAAVVAAARAAVDGGAAMVKVKIRPGADLEVLSALRAELGDHPLAADANGSYQGAPDRAIDALDGTGLAYLEQPLAPADLVGAARLSARLRTPVALDESLDGVDALRTALALGACRVANVKPARVGGAREAAAMLDLARDAGISAFVGGLLELGVGRAHALAVAACDGADLPTDLGPSAQYVARDVTAPIGLDARRWLVVPDGVGIGVAPLWDRLDEMAVDRVVVSR